MNYRHAFHAGSFADVLKHIVLVRILLYLQEKQAPFRVIDTHAGAGRYDLAGDEAQRSGEWLTGIARMMQARFSEQALPLLKPYLDIVRAFNSGAELAAYPGSPLIARALLRPQDRLTACELEPVARKQLIDALRRDSQARVVDLDGWTPLTAFVPPRERRGLVLIDPPFEERDEFERLATGFHGAFQKWPTGSYLLWYPVKSRRAADTLAREVAQSAEGAKPSAKCLRLEFSVAPQEAGGPLAKRRLAEVQKADKVLGVTCEVLDIHDGELEPSLENRKKITRLIRDWKADIVTARRSSVWCQILLARRACGQRGGAGDRAVINAHPLTTACPAATPTLWSSPPWRARCRT